MKTTSWILVAAVIAVLTLTLFARNKTGAEASPVPVESSPSPAAAPSAESIETITVQFTLKTIADKGKLLFEGVGGGVDGIVNPDLIVPTGAVVGNHLDQCRRHAA